MVDPTDDMQGNRSRPLHRCTEHPKQLVVLSNSTKIFALVYAAQKNKKQFTTKNKNKKRVEIK